jgi:hypothetical protein
MARKKEFFVRVTIEGKDFRIPLDVAKTGYRSWEISKYGFCMGSVGGDNVAARDEGIRIVQSNMMSIIIDGWVEKSKGMLEVGYSLSRIGNGCLSRIGNDNTVTPTPEFFIQHKNSAITFGMLKRNPLSVPSAVKSAGWSWFNILYVIGRWMEESKDLIVLNRISKKFGL